MNSRGGSNNTTRSGDDSTTTMDRGGGDHDSTIRNRTTVEAPSIVNTTTTTSTSTSTSAGKDEAGPSNSKEDNATFWSRDLDHHYTGYFSFAVLQANEILEDFSQVEIGEESTFVGVYDGHGGPLAARYVREHLVDQLMGQVRENANMSEDALRQAFLGTDEAWLDLVAMLFGSRKLMAATGTCCLVGVIWRGNLYVANVGDSRAVIGRLADDGSNGIVAHQLTRDDNVRDPLVRQEVEAFNPEEPDILVLVNDIYRIKGRIQVSRSIGDAYLKRTEFFLNPYTDRYTISSPLINPPALSTEPTTSTIAIQATDRFVIFASDGLWELMSNQDAAEIVHNSPRQGIATRLITEALDRKVKILGGSSYQEVLEIKIDSKGSRRKIHDDITVVVIYLDEDSQVGDIKEVIERMSAKGGDKGIETVGETNFTALDELP